MKAKALKSVLLTITTFIALSLGNFGLAIECATCSDQANLSAQQAAECGTSCASSNNQTPEQAVQNVNGTFENVVNILSVAIGAVAVIMLMIGGFRYISSGGKQESVASAKNTILYAVIGLVVVAVAQVFVQFVINKAANPGK